MKKIIGFILIIMIMFVQSIEAEAAELIVNDKNIKIETSEVAKKPLLTDAIELQGAESSRDFYFTLTEDVKDDQDYVVTFFIRHSELLITPSSFTVKLDDQPLKTVSLTGDQLYQSVKVQLPKSFLTKGIHKVSANFYGVVKEGVCVAPGQVGNWLRIDPNSYISSFAKEGDMWTFADYPNAFLSEEENETTLIVPSDSSMQTLNYAYQLAAYLQGQSNEQVNITTEDEVTKVNGSVIFIGLKDEFKSSYITSFIEKMKIEDTPSLSLQMASMMNESGGAHLPALFVIANDEGAYEERLKVLMNAHLNEQLYGEDMTILSTPAVNDRLAGATQLKKLGFYSQTLSSQVTETMPLYMSLPQVAPNSEAYLQLQFKKSATLKEEALKNERQVELIVHINGVPHSIDLLSVNEASADLYEATIPIAAKTLNKQKLTTIQFEVTGFHLEDPCAISGEKYWLYIDEESELVLPNEEVKPTFTMMDFPRAFHQESVIIIASKENMNQGAMVDLYQSLMMNGVNANTALIEESEIEQQQLNGASLIYIGDNESDTAFIDQLPLLPKLEDDFLQLGFLPNMRRDLAVMTQSGWDANQPLLYIQLDQMNDDRKTIINSLQEINEEKEAAILTKDGQLIVENTAEKQTELDKSEEKTIPWLMIVQFLVLIIIIAAALIIILRRRKKRYMKDES